MSKRRGQKHHPSLLETWKAPQQENAAPEPVAPQIVEPIAPVRRCGRCAWFVAMPEHGMCHESPQLVRKRPADWCSKFTERTLIEKKENTNA